MSRVTPRTSEHGGGQEFLELYLPEAEILGSWPSAFNMELRDQISPLAGLSGGPLIGCETACSALLHAAAVRVSGSKFGVLCPALVLAKAFVRSHLLVRLSVKVMISLQDFNREEILHGNGGYNNNEMIITT